LSEYIFNLDAHSLALTCIQLIVEVTAGDVPAHSQPLYKAWETYWQDSTRFWKQLMAFVRGQSGGDFNKLKSAFLQQQIAETYGRNIQCLRTALTACASSSAVEHSTFFATLAAMLAGRRLEWSSIAALLESTPSQAALAQPVPAPVTKRTHRRQHTSDSTPSLTRDVPEVSVESRIGEYTHLVNAQRRHSLGLGVSGSPPPITPAIVGLERSSSFSSGAVRRAQSEDGSRAFPLVGLERHAFRPPSVISLRKITEENFRKATDENIRLM